MSGIKIEKLDFFYKSTTCVKSVLYFGKPYCLVICGSNDGIVRVIDRNGTLVGEIRGSKSEQYLGKIISSLMKWSKNSFYSASRGGKITFFKIDPFIKIREFKYAFCTFRLLKLSDDDFLIGSERDFCEVNHKSQELRKFGNTGQFREWKMKLKKSVNFENCFYFSMRSEIFLENWKTGKLIHTFDKLFLGLKEEIRTIGVFLNTRKEEMVVFGGRDYVLKFLNCGTNFDEISKSNVSTVMSLSDGYHITASCVFGNSKKYVIVGDVFGFVHVVSENEMELASSKVLTCWIYDFKCHTFNDNDGRTGIEILGADEHGVLALFRIFGLIGINNLSTQQEMEDLDERVTFLMENMKNEYFDSSQLFEIRCGYHMICCTSKIFLLL